MDKVFLARMLDQSFRSRDARRVSGQLVSLVRRYGIPSFFSNREKALLWLFFLVGRHFPDLSVPAVMARLRETSAENILPGEPGPLRAHLEKRKRQGVRMNINHLGEAVLGEEEAYRRLNIYLEDLKSPDVECISVKISTLYSQIRPLAFEHTVARLEERLAALLRTAEAHRFIRKDGTQAPKVVHLDMEEYRDLALTVAAFTGALDTGGLEQATAGIVLQAYLPDSFPIQQQLTAWAKKRVARGASPIYLRIVKGANREMEHVEAAIRDWPLAPYDSKLDVDANYKRMIDFGMMPENIKTVHLGIASHNLFELAYAHCLAERNGVSQHVTFEMLEGMADHVRRAIKKTVGDVLLYAPVATRDQFIYAIAYLIRRLDENTGEENFLRHSFDLKPRSKAWQALKDQFVASFHHRQNAGSLPHRYQNRLQEDPAESPPPHPHQPFRNEPDTDFCLSANRQWANQVRKKWKKGPHAKPVPVPIVVGDEERYEGRDLRDCIDPSQNHGEGPKKVCMATVAMGNQEDVDRAVAAAKSDPDGWREKTFEERQRILARVAGELRAARGDLIGAAAADTGKVFTESDTEVSEAVDFAEYYPASVTAFSALPHLQCRGKGVGLVISPWNFPIAIPSGGIVASLAGGNTVILKPSSSAVLVAWELCRCFWRAGVSRKVLQFLPCDGPSVGNGLVRHPDVDFIILTGATETGLAVLRERPHICLAAETGGKNATIVSAASDRDQAIRNVVYSAFGNSGQKCSATSLLILEKEVYRDEAFRRQLVDAARSYAVGSAWDFENSMGPLIRPPEGDLETALTQLEPGESWALKPKMLSGNPRLWTPGIKWDVGPGSFTHQTEFFGPVLGVMCAESLEQAIDMANQTGYGLTSGLESLEPGEHEIFKARIRAGNLYINRGTTGARVLRQPFGGMGKSALGSGIKAGGPNYVTQFMDFEETGFPPERPTQKNGALLRLARQWEEALDAGQFHRHETERRKTVCALRSYLYWSEQLFGRETDFFHIRGQDNILRFLPVGRVLIRVHRDDSLFEVLARILAARITGCDPQVSIAATLDNPVVTFLRGAPCRPLLANIPIAFHDDPEVIASMAQVDRIRYASPDRVAAEVSSAASRTGFYIARSKVLMQGRLELLHYLREQAICYNYHRYGNLGERAGAQT